MNELAAILTVVGFISFLSAWFSCHRRLKVLVTTGSVCLPDPPEEVRKRKSDPDPRAVGVLAIIGLAIVVFEGVLGALALCLLVALAAGLPEGAKALYHETGEGDYPALDDAYRAKAVRAAKFGAGAMALPVWFLVCELYFAWAG